VPAKRTIYVFPGNGTWYRVEIPYADEFAESLGAGDNYAWASVLGVISKLLAEAGV